MLSVDKFTIAYEKPEYRIYTPINTMEYHTSRLLEATLQNVYSGAGATEETIVKHLDAIIELCNQTGEVKTIRTDIAGIANALKMRTRFPIDKHCSVRMGAILSFLEYKQGERWIAEDPNKTETFWLERKMELAMSDPELYTFFFSMGAVSTQAYSNLLDTLNDGDYFEKRRMNLIAMLPQSHLELSKI